MAAWRRGCECDRELGTRDGRRCALQCCSLDTATVEECERWVWSVVETRDRTVALPEGMEVVRRVLEETKDYAKGMELCDRLCNVFGDVGMEGAVEARWWLSRRWRGSGGANCGSCWNRPRWTSLCQWIVAIGLFLGNRRDLTTRYNKGKHISFVITVVESDHGMKPRLLRLQNVARREMETLEAAFRLILVQTGQVVNDIHLSDVRLQSRIRQHG